MITATQKYIVFRIANYPLALPVDRVLKVLTCPDNLGKMLRDTWLAQMGQRMIMILNLHQSFEKKNREELDREDDFGKFLLLVKGDRDEICGIPIDEPPNLEEIPDETIQEVPPSYYQVGLPNWIARISIIKNNNTTKAILMLDIDRALGARAQMLVAQPATLKALSQIETVETQATVEIIAV
jgi:purine-binding chemotaxis protein CheW